MIAALAVTVGIGIVRGASAPTETVTLDSGGTAPTAVDAAEVYVHVSGAVLSPGLYVLDDSARVVDVIAAAGGFAADADQAAVNLARPVSDGEQLVVPVVGAAARRGGGSARRRPHQPQHGELGRARDAAAHRPVDGRADHRVA